MSVYTATQIVSDQQITVTEADDLVKLDLTPVADTAIEISLSPVQLLSAVVSVNGETGIVVLTTDDVDEGTTNLYYTQDRFDTAFGNKTTTDLTEGDNLYYTDARVDDLLRSGDVDVINFTDGAATLDWNINDGTLNLNYANTVSLQLGQETHFYAKATEAISNGDIVMFAGAQGSHLLVALADQSAPDFQPEYVIGVATQDFNINEFGYVTSFGKVRDLDTSAYTEGDIIWLDPATPGGWITTRPTPAQGHSIQVAAVTYSQNNNGTIFVRPTHMPDTDETPEGSTNLYYTDARVQTVIDTNTAGFATETYVDTAKADAISAANAYTLNQIGMLDIPASTTDLAEGTNLYYTDARVQTVIDTNTADFATESYVDTAESDAISAANLYTDGRETAITTAYQNYADAGDAQAYSDALADANSYTDTSIANLIDSAPATLDTLNELAAALGDDPNFATTITNSIATKLATADFNTTADTWLTGKTTTNLTEGDNLYYTDTRATAAVDARVTGTFIENLTYDTDGGTY